MFLKWVKIDNMGYICRKGLLFKKYFIFVKIVNIWKK